jgi:hypothetical protein
MNRLWLLNSDQALTLTGLAGDLLRMLVLYRFHQNYGRLLYEMVKLFLRTTFTAQAEKPRTFANVDFTNFILNNLGVPEAFASFPQEMLVNTDSADFGAIQDALFTLLYQFIASLDEMSVEFRIF